jgi:hypothetical protein
MAAVSAAPTCSDITPDSASWTRLPVGSRIVPIPHRPQVWLDARRARPWVAQPLVGATSGNLAANTAARSCLPAMAVCECRHDAVRKLACSPLRGVFAAERGRRLKFKDSCEFLSSSLPSSPPASAIAGSKFRRSLDRPVADGAAVLLLSRSPVEGDPLSGSIRGLSNIRRGPSSGPGRILQPDLTAEGDGSIHRRVGRQ